MNDAGMSGRQVLARRKRTRIRTTILELITGVMDRTPDEASLIASLKHIFAASDVRAVRSLAPVRLIMKEAPGGQPYARRRKAKTICA